MPYNSWVQFRRQRASLGLSATMSLLLHEYQVRPLSHSRWNNFDAYSAADAALLGVLPAWLPKIAGIVRVQTAGLPTELLQGVKSFGAILESLISQLIRATAGGAVIYDGATDRLYYGASRWVPGLQVHAALLAREKQLPVVQTSSGSLNTLVPNRSARVCGEFQALNAALLDGAQETNLHLWCFRARSMEPFPRCPNCRVTLGQNALARVWTC